MSYIKCTLIILVSFYNFYGCSSFLGKPKHYQPVYEQNEARELMLKLINRNEKLKTFKGIGKIRFLQEGKYQSSRAVWIAAENKKIRIEFLSISGHPALTFTCDGESIYFLSHIDNRYYKKPDSDQSLKKFISLPIKSSHIIAFLTGRIPIVDYTSASIIKSKASCYIIVLKGKHGKAVEKIYLAENAKDVEKIEVFDNNGASIYQVTLDNIQFVEEYGIALKLSFLDIKGNSLEIKIDRYWPNINISKAQFVLHPPENDK